MVKEQWHLLRSSITLIVVVVGSINLSSPFMMNRPGHLARCRPLVCGNFHKKTCHFDKVNLEPRCKVEPSYIYIYIERRVKFLPPTNTVCLSVTSDRAKLFVGAVQGIEDSVLRYPNFP